MPIRHAIIAAFAAALLALQGCSAQDATQGGTQINTSSTTQPNSPSPGVQVKNDQTTGTVAVDAEMRDVIGKIGKLADVGVKFFTRDTDSHDKVEGSVNRGTSGSTGDNSPVTNNVWNGWGILISQGLTLLALIVVIFFWMRAHVRGVRYSNKLVRNGINPEQPGE